MNKKTMIAVAVAVVAVGILLGGSLVGGLFTSSNVNEVQDTNMIQPQQQETQKAQVEANDLIVGTGAEAIPGKEITVNYTGVFQSTGKKFDSSLDRGVPFTFTLGAGQVIKGWDIGVEGMKVGGKRILIIPSEFGYGANDYGPIPGNSTLLFEIDLISVK